MATCGRDSSSSDEEIPKPKVINKRRMNNFMTSDSEEDSEIDVKSKQKRKVKRLRESDSETDSGLSTSTSWTSIPKIRKSKNRKSGHDVEDNRQTSNDFSDGEQSEKCAICLCKFLGQPVASPETCDHTFCSTCLLEWAKKVNTCPIDRMRFRYVLIKHQNSPDLCERIPVTNQRRFVVTSSDSSDAVICEMCGDESSTNLMLCDRCGLGYHTSCVPEMFPLGAMSLEWYCPYCQHVRNEENVRLRRLFLQQIGRECVTGHEYVRLRRLNVVLFNQNRQTVPSYSVAHIDSNSSSADSSDESSELSSSSERRERCQAVRDRRQKRTPTKLLDQFISAFRRTTARHTTPSTSSRSHSFYTTNDSDSDALDYGYEDNGGVISSVRRNPVMRTKGIRTSCRLRFRASSPPGSKTDILEDILAMQTRLHGPTSNIEEAVSVNVNPNNIGLQQPMHPVQKSSTSSNGSRHSASSSSSSSAASGSSHYDLYNMPSCSALTHGTSAESYNTESCSTVTHCNNGNTSTAQDDFKKDTREALHVKDGRKNQSDDEVDIYSDIEYANDETSLDADVQAMSVSYKPDESHLATVGDGTDSSDDNDLVIDEDVPAEEENRHSVDKRTAVNSALPETAVESENSSDSCLADDCEPTSENNIPESAQSPDIIENANLESESRWQEHNESEESTEQVCNNKSNYEAKKYVDSDGDSREAECEDNNTRDGNHSQTSFDSNYDNQGPKSPEDENGSSPPKNMTPVMEDNSTDNATEDFEGTLPDENDQDSIVEQDHCENSSKEINENEDIMNDKNSVTKSENSDDDDNGTEDEECSIKAEVEDGGNKTEDEGNKSEDEEIGNKSEDEEIGNKSEDEEVGNKSEDEEVGNKSEDEEVGNKSEDEVGNKSEDEEVDNIGEVGNKTDDEIVNKTDDEEVDNKTDEENDNNTDEENDKTDDEEGGNKTEDDGDNKTDDDGNKMEYDEVGNKIECDEKASESDENNIKNDDNECSNDNCDNMENGSLINETMESENQEELNCDEYPKEPDSPKTFSNATKKSVTEIRSSGKEFPTKASLKECIPVEGEFETNKNSHEDSTYQNIDLGIEDISDAASDDLNQLDNDTPEPMECDGIRQATLDDVEKNVAKLFGADDNSSSKHNRSHQRSSYHERTSDDAKRYSSSRQALIDDQEEGEIIEDIPYSRKEIRRERFARDDDEYLDSAPRINISDLPRIPKIKRESKPNIPEEPPLELKRTSVLGRVDLGNSDVGWKRLSKHTRERSYRDGRPKDDNLLFRERELKSKEKNRKHSSNERKNDSKLIELDRRKNEDKKQDRDRSRDRNQSDRSRERRSNKSDHEKSSKQMDWSYTEKKDKEKHTKHKDRYEREKMKKDRHESKKDRHDKNKEKSRRDDSKHEREKLRAEEKYAREVERYHQSDEAYERMYEKPRDKEHKHKHKDSKSESGKKCKDDKHKRTHSREHFSEKREREVRKVDDKLKIVVEHKESRIKDKSDKIGEKRDSKHDKKHRDNAHHHERKKKDLSPISYSELTPIESKEIFTKGDSIIINVNFNRASPREVIAGGSEDFNRDKKSNSNDLTKIDNNFNLDDSHGSKSKHSSLDSDKKSDAKRPSTPTERNNQAISGNECYWSDADDADVKSPNDEKSPVDKMCNEDDDSSNTPPNNFGADDNLTDSGDEENLPETQPVNLLSKEGIEPDVSSISSEKAQQENLYSENKETDNFNSSRRRSPIHPPSPPSPPDNDSYDPCEPTKSPSPPPNPSSPPLPTMCLSDRPKPPPSPELPPLPPEPEPTDAVFQEDGHSVKSSVPSQPSDMPNSSASSPVVSQLEHYSTSGNEPTNAGPGILLPPPRFMGHVNVSTMSSQLTPSKTMSWHVQNPPSTMMFQSSHLQPVIRGNFLPSHIPTVGLPPPNVSATMLPPNSSIPLMSQVRHLQLGPHSIVPTNTLLPNISMNHLNLPQVQISHMNPPLPNPSVAVSVQQHQTITMQGHPGNLPNSISSHCGGIGLMPPQNQLSSIAISLQNQHGNLVPTLHQQNVSQSFPSQNQVSHPGPSNSQKSDKLSKASPAKDRSEVIDMDVDSPYSPGDSPSMDSAYDYSPPSSPVPHEGPGTKDVFDTLLGTERSSGSHSNKVSNKNRHSSNCVERESKRLKAETRNDSNKNRHHSIRLQVAEKMKSRKEHRVSERREVFSRVDDSQLTILDELPSSAVEMQVKEKFIKKLNRQERVVEEVKCALKPYYKAREVSKDEYKDILRKCVPKICHNKSGEINPQKVKYLVECYVRKVKHSRKKSSKRHKSSKLS